MMQKILTMGVVIGSLAAWGYDVGDYVQDGLVAQYDGIRNVGAALPHDDAAQYWVNLASPSNSLEFVGQNVASGSWTANGYSFTGSSAAQMTNSLALGNAFTIEIVLTANPDANTASFPNWVDGCSDYGIFTSLSAKTTLQWKCDGWTGSGRPKVYGWAGDYLVAVLTATNAYLTSGTKYENAKAVKGDCDHATARWAFGGGMNTKDPTVRYVVGAYHAMRLYNRPLTEAELAHNRAIDEVRFRRTASEVVVPIGDGKTVTIPTSWFETGKIGERSVFDPAAFAAKFGTDWLAAAVMPTGKAATDGSPMYVWQDYVNGCDPTNPEDVFRATIEMVDGVPYIGWEPNLNTIETLRVYRILGKTDLADAGEQWGRVRSGHRFFKVTVEMPNGSAVSDEPGPVDVGGKWEPNLLCHLSFDDAGNGGLNVLKVRGGDDAVVRTTPANVVSGLGSVTVVTDPGILAGLEPGDGAVKIPLSTHIALPIPTALQDREGHPYTLKMKVKFPSFGRYYAILNMPGSNDSDDMVFLTDSGNPVIALKIMDKSYGQADGGKGGFAVNTWEELTFQFGETNTRILLNGNEIYSRNLKLADSYADCYDAGGCFVISGDPDDEDSEMYWADVKVYDGIVD